MNLWQRFKKWCSDFGEEVFDFMETPVAMTLFRYKPIAKLIVLKAANFAGTGKEKFAYATALFLAEVPGAVLYLVEMAIQSEYETEIMPKKIKEG